MEEEKRTCKRRIGTTKVNGDIYMSIINIMFEVKKTTVLTNES